MVWKNIKKCAVYNAVCFIVFEASSCVLAVVTDEESGVIITA